MGLVPRFAPGVEGLAAPSGLLAGEAGGVRPSGGLFDRGKRAAAAAGFFVGGGLAGC